jgi:hypothetical protein
VAVLAVLVQKHSDRAFYHNICQSVPSTGQFHQHSVTIATAVKAQRVMHLQILHRSVKQLIKTLTIASKNVCISYSRKRDLGSIRGAKFQTSDLGPIPRPEDLGLDLGRVPRPRVWAHPTERICSCKLLMIPTQHVAQHIKYKCLGRSSQHIC